MRFTRSFNSILTCAVFAIATFSQWQPMPAKAAGASLFLSPSVGSYVIGDRFTVNVKAFVGGTNINASEGGITFDKNVLEVAAVSDTGSIFSLWTTQPSFSNSNGTISFGGGLQAPGFSGQQGKVIGITFVAKAVGTASVRFSNGAILANDGKGSNILESMGSANFTIVAKDQNPAAIKPGSGIAPTNVLTVEPIDKLSNGSSSDEYMKPVIVSTTNPDQNAWTKSNNVQFQWDVPKKAIGMSWSVDKDYKGKPEEKVRGLLTNKTVEGLADGIWYFHLKFYDSKKWGAIGTYRVLIDTNRPESLSINIQQADQNSFPKLMFKTTDLMSGVDHYEVFVNSFDEKEATLPEDDAQSQLAVQLTNLEYGKHTALIKVLDKAGNETVSTVNFEIQPIETPVVKNYAKEVKESDQFFVSGTALPDTAINVYIQNEENKVTAAAIKSDANGGWFFLGPSKLKNGRYIMWVEAENSAGLKSKPTEKLTFLVTPPVFAVIGNFVINYFTVLVSLLFMVLLIGVLLFYIIALIRKKLKKETVEVETVLQQNLANLKKIVDDEVAKLSQLAPAPAAVKEGKRMKDTFASQVDQARKKIMKEIKDVEDILK